MPLAASFPWEAATRLDWRAALDVLLIAVLIYYLLARLRGTLAVQIAIAMVLLLLLYRGARWARLEMVEWLLTVLLSYSAIALLILFQPEIRRAFARMGQSPLWKRFLANNPGETYDDILLAIRHFAEHRIGALMVIGRETGLRTYIESGVPLDAALSYDLLLSIFLPGAPLHDGAAIVVGDRIAAAACFLPLTLNPTFSTPLGSRHRAAIGVTEDSDAIAVLVSEQSGEIALAHDGEIERALTPDQLTVRLAGLVGGFRAPAPGAAVPRFRE